MARLESVSKTWDEYKGWLFIMFGGYILWSFRGVISSLGNTANAGVGALTDGLIEQAQTKSDVSKVKAAMPSLAKRKVTDEDVATYRADATTLANYLGQGNLTLASVFKDQDEAFGLLKRRYSRLKLWNNKPCYMVSRSKDGKTMQVKNTENETSNSLKNDVNYKVLIPFYREVTNGRDLVADVRYFITGSHKKALLKWVL
jgi:hypothetical protein